MKKIVALILGFLLLIPALSACDFDEDQGEQRKEAQDLSNKALDQQVDAVPYPADDLVDSLERRNLKERLLRQNDPDRIGYVYFVSFGKFLGYWTIKGKVSSTQSQMNPSDDVSNDLCGSGCSEHVVSESAGDDGSYGENEAGVFFFTTDGVMVQLPEDSYVYSDQPILLGGIPELNKQ